MKDNKRKEPKQKPSGRLSKAQLRRTLPKTVARQVCLKSKERFHSVTKSDADSSYASAQEMEEQGIRQGKTMLEDGVILDLGKAENAARKHLTCKREPDRHTPQNTVHDEPYASEDRRPIYREGANSNMEFVERQERNRRVAQNQSRNFQGRKRQEKNVARGLRGVDRNQKQLRTAVNTVRQEKRARQAALRTQVMLSRAQTNCSRWRGTSQTAGHL